MKRSEENIHLERKKERNQNQASFETEEKKM